MKSRYAAILAVSFLCVLLTLSAVGCQDNDADIYKEVIGSQAKPAQDQVSHHNGSQEAHASNSKVLQGHLTVTSYWDTTLSECAADFMKLHPQVTMDVILPDIDTLQTFDEYHNQIVVELMSGKAPDVTDLSGFCVYKYAKSGLLCNLYPLMDQDAGFNKEEYYTNIFTAKEYDGGLYSMPCGFSYDMVYASKPLLQKAGVACPTQLDYKTVFELYRRVTEKTGKAAAPRIMPGLDPYTFFYYEFPDYYDVQTQKAWFNSKEFVEYLNATQAVIPVNVENDFTRIVETDAFMKQDYLLCRFDITFGFDIYNFLVDFQNITDPIPMLSVNGKACFRTMRDYAIPQSCENKQLAWEFIKYYISEKDVPDITDEEGARRYSTVYNSFVPINIANFYKSFRFDCEYYAKYMNKEITNWKPVDRETVINQTLDLMNSWNKQRNTEEAEGEIYGALYDDLDNFYLQRITTAEETANIIQNKMTAFLTE